MRLAVTGCDDKRTRRMYEGQLLGVRRLDAQLRLGVELRAAGR